MSHDQPQAWRTVTIEDLGQVVTGRTPPSSKPEMFGSEYPFITPSDMSFGLRRVTTERSISLVGSLALGRIKLPPKSVAFVCIGATIGKVCLTFEDSFTNQQINSIVVDCDRHSPEFVYYLMLGMVDKVKALAGGAATPIVNKSSFCGISVSIPPIETQSKIAFILSAYDDLIENNTRRIEILEEMARRLYEEWFVQFRFPGHEGVEFTDSSLGLIPVGWTVGCLQDVITLQRGFDLPVQHRLAGSVPIISATGIGGSHVEAKVKGPGVVTGRSGSIGKVMYVHDDHWPLNTTLWGANYPLGSTLFAYYVLSSIDLKGFNVGAAVPTLNRNDIHGLPVNIPPKEIVQSFEKVAEPLHNLTEKLRRKNANLRAQRDLLLPKLISGEIDVSDIPMPT